MEWKVKVMKLCPAEVGEESREDIGCEDLVFVVECFPGMGLVEEKIEQGQIFLLQYGSPSLPGSSRSRW
jgi:hypothetical protein